MIWRGVVFFDLPLLGQHFIDASIQGLIVCDRGNLNTISKYIKPAGLIVITIRPVEYWDIDAHANAGGGVVEQRKSQHRAYGFSFLPHNRKPIDGDITYGDTSMSLDWLEAAFPNLEIMGTDRSLSDPYQIYVFLRFR
jgi:hypothetical protein